MSDIKHRAAQRRVRFKMSAKGKGWDIERWLLEYIAEFLSRRLGQIHSKAVREGYDYHRWAVRQTMTRWCEARDNLSDGRMEYYLTGPGLRRLLDLRELERQENETTDEEYD